VRYSLADGMIAISTTRSIDQKNGLVEHNCITMHGTRRTGNWVLKLLRRM